LFKNFSEDYYYNNVPKFVHNKAGYDLVFETEAAVISGKATLTDGTLIWVIGNSAPYTVADKTALTFATICTAKTDWSTEITAETAVYVDAPKHYDVIITAAAGVYIIDKWVDRKVDLFGGETSKTYVGAAFKTPDVSDEYTEWTVTRTAEAWHPTSGKRLANLESFLDKKTRQYGSYNYMEFPFVPIVVEATGYYTVTVKYKASDTTRMLTGNPQESIVVIACAQEGNADTIVAKIALAQG